MRRLAIFAAVLTLAGCATTERVWVGGDNFDRDQGFCHAQAFGTPFANNFQVAMVYNGCMRGKGWQLVEQPRR